eukprot:TRINITY_DN33600_c0_g1_i2.p1 TRINITY_DN33600_c0_g1~~TRINITY_DN33600_c0_g1_i2.p1  ORF type:complete len:106 (-),score=22.44 TRINITY_DN33600_c0_g1_i2:27-344(-)
MIRRPPRSTQGVSSAASDVYKRQLHILLLYVHLPLVELLYLFLPVHLLHLLPLFLYCPHVLCVDTVSYTHLRAHETSLHLVCRLLLEKKKKKFKQQIKNIIFTKN